MGCLRTGVLAVACAALLAGCGGGGGGAAESTGTLNLKLTDSPVDDAEKVIVVFTGIELKPRGGPAVSLAVTCADDPATPEAECVNGNAYVDLMKLQDGVTLDLLRNRSVEAGDYEWMRLKVLAERNNQSGSYIKMRDGSQYPLYVPSGAETGLKLVRPFTVAQGGITKLVIDFDIRKSVIDPPGLAGDYVLKPTLRLTDELVTGTVRGTVSLAALATEQGATSCDGGVYLFAGHDAVPDDMDGTPADPVVYRKLEPGATDPAVATYMFPFVEAGSEAGKYTVAFTCNFGVDAAPDASEYDPNAASGQPGFGTMKWTKTNTTVGAAGETAVVDFPFP
jgi:hypothetical protein